MAADSLTLRTLSQVKIQANFLKSPSALHTLLEINRYAPQLLTPKFEIYIDGGVRRGTDVIKALCLGAKGCGLGRPFLFSLVGHGVEGSKHACQIMQEELVTAMKLLGCNTIADLCPELINTSVLDAEIADLALVKKRMKAWSKYRRQSWFWSRL